MKARVSLKMSSKALQVAQKKSISLAMDDIWYVMRKAEEYAREQYAVAKYDGVDPAVSITVRAEQTSPLTITLIAEGDTVPFVEYGTGVSFNKPWFFKIRGRKIVTKSTGKLLKTRKYIRTTRSDFSYRGRALKPEYFTRVQRDADGPYITGDKGRRLTLWETRSKASSPYEVEKQRTEPVYRTYGNEPAAVMSKTRDFIYEEIAKLEKRYISR